MCRRTPRRIAVVGASPNPARPSNGVLAFRVAQGHDVIAVNPGHAGSTIHGAPVVATLANVEPPAEIVEASSGEVYEPTHNTMNIQP